MRTRASILVGLLWCLALLSIIVIGLLHTARLDLFVTKNFGDRIQAHYLALAGVEKAKALLYQNARERSRNGKNHTGELFDDPQQFRENRFARGKFRVFRQGRDDEGGGIIYGISDEESRLNINFAQTNELSKIYGMTPDVMAAIVDWRDGDNLATPGGAEADYYGSMQPPYLPRNGPFQTVRELLMVRGISRDLLFGRNSAEDDLLGDDTENAPARRQGTLLDTGWADVMTVASSEDNISASGEGRVNVQSADERELTSVRGITSDIAKAIVAYRGQRPLQSLADLLDVSASRPDAQPRPAGSSGPSVISEDLLCDIADGLTIDSSLTLSGLVNINSAGLDVLTCLPGLDRQLAQAIISYRQSSGYFPNVAWLLKVPGITRDIFKQVLPRVSARSETYRILSEGKIDSSGARERIMVTVHVGLRQVSTLSYREDNL